MKKIGFSEEITCSDFGLSICFIGPILVESNKPDSCRAPLVAHSRSTCWALAHKTLPNQVYIGKEGPITQILLNFILEDMKSGPSSVQLPVPY